jgi:hypothetical protein
MIDGIEQEVPTTLYKLTMIYPATDTTPEGQATVLTAITQRELLRLYDVIRGA